ncbi:MAG: TetR/AcrR family transcriptional regulator [Thermodesulfobacteriota bacterium]|nr:TetR/AcrR family transcriptional regulator [Thermodesulfobacteriota bacterium]
MVKKRICADERRRQILEAAQKICSEKGFSGTTFDEIAKKAGISRALLVQHFKSKIGLYDALLEFCFEGNLTLGFQGMREKMEAKEDFDVFCMYALHIFEQLFQQYDYSLMRLIQFSMLENTELYKKYYLERASVGLDALENYISLRMHDGAFKDVDPSQTALSFRAMVVQRLLHESTINGNVDKEAFLDMVEKMIQIFLGGLLGSGSTTTNGEENEGKEDV